MGMNCNNCNTMEDEIYWKCFKTVQFSQILSHHFHHQLEVPQKFVKNLREKLGKEVSLKGPSGTIWKVGLVTERDSLYFKLGWNEFIEYNSLEENDMLIFKYNGNSDFDVLMFDGKSMCEKATSYFVRKCVHPDMPREGRKGKNDTSEKNSDQVTIERHSPQNEDGGQVEESFHVESASDGDDGIEWIAPNKSKKADEEALNSGRRCATANSNIHKRKRAEARPVPLEFLSNRRTVTEEEKANAVQRANDEASDESLVIIMKDYHAYSRFWATLPAWWSNNHLPPTHQILKLQLEGKLWPVKFYKKVTGGTLIAGWKKFALDNSLEKDDVCLFNIVSAESSSIVIDVKIFRVVEEVVPPTPLRLQSPGRRGRPPSSGRRGRPPSSGQRGL